MKLTVADYFGKWTGHRDVTPSVIKNSEKLVELVNILLARAESHGVRLEMNPITKTLVSGQTLGGFRPQDADQGAPRSSHKTGQGVDIYDPDGELDNWIMGNRSVLDIIGLAIEHPSATRGWCHITTRLPPSGRRIFYP